MNAGQRARLGAYLYVAAQTDVPTISSREIADVCGLHSSQVRRDLSIIQLAGKRGVGFPSKRLAQGLALLLHDGAHGAGLVLIAGARQRIPALADLGASTGNHATGRITELITRGAFMAAEIDRMLVDELGEAAA